MKWFYKLQNKYRIFIAVGAWVLTVIFATATSSLMDDESYSLIISVIGCILLAASIFFTVFAVKANKRKSSTPQTQLNRPVVHAQTSVSYEVKPRIIVNSIDNILKTDGITPPRDFGKWNGINGGKEQLARFKRACLAENTPVEIIPEEARGVFSGAHGIYNTTLEDCTCVDFQRRNLPCKHIYRLAIELGLLEGDMQTDKSGIISPDNTGLSLAAAVDITETLSPYGQTILREILLDLTYRNKRVHKRNSGCDYSEVLDSGLVEETTEGIVTADELKSERRNLCIYLGRRNEDDYYYDPDKEEYLPFPKGAQHYATIDIGLGVSSSEFGIEFPDDKITAELDKRGLNRCHAYNASRRK